jgi:hypothetical protein
MAISSQTGTTDDRGQEKDIEAKQQLPTNTPRFWNIDHVRKRWSMPNPGGIKVEIALAEKCCRWHSMEYLQYRETDVFALNWQP